MSLSKMLRVQKEMSTPIDDPSAPMGNLSWEIIKQKLLESQGAAPAIAATPPSPAFPAVQKYLQQKVGAEAEALPVAPTGAAPVEAVGGAAMSPEELERLKKLLQQSTPSQGP